MRCANNPNLPTNLRDHFSFSYTTADGQAWIDRCPAMKPPQAQIAVAKAMVEYVFYRPGVDRIESCTFGWNARSRRVLESAGFAHEGRPVDTVVENGRATDQLLFGLNRDAR